MAFDPGPLLEEFRDEAQQQLDRLDRALLTLEQEGELEEESRLELLRVLHTLKGNAAMVGLRPISEQVHRIETVFKEAGPAPSRELLDGMFELSAVIRSAIDRVGTAEQESAMRRVASARLPLSDSAEDTSPAATSRGEATAAATPSAPAGAPADAASEPAPAAEGAAPPPPGEAEPAPGPGPESGSEITAAAASSTPEVLRVPFTKLDELLTSVGELVAFHARLEAFVEANTRALRRTGVLRELEEHLEDLAALGAELGDTTMDLRLVPLRTIFGRFHGLVRELAREQGKRALLTVEGEQIEIDKSAADALAEPLLHLLRNAIDHGIEPPEERQRAGKEETGTIHLRAIREGDQIRIEVTDDGRGLDHAAILRRAREAGLVAAGAEPPDEEIADLVFEPGFSTRREASTLSGRGLGLDIVRRGVVSLRGSLAVEEVASGGTRFVLRLPLTLAIVPALVFESAGEMLALPAGDVQQTIPLPETRRVAGADVVRHQGGLLPLARPRELFGWAAEPGNGAAPASEGAQSAAVDEPERFAIVIDAGGRSAAICADRLVGQQNLVVKAIPGFLGPMRGLSGVVPGVRGRVVLVLDGRGILELNMDAQRRLSRAG